MELSFDALREAPPHVLFAFGVELVLVLLTLLFLVRPRLFFKSESAALHLTLHWIGVIFFCLLFVWSVVVGVLVQLTPGGM